MSRQGACSLVAFGLTSTPEAVHTANPLWDHAGRLSIVFIGRVDNRETLIDALALPREQSRTLPDAALVLSGYRRWKTGTASRLLGDFAFAIWDETASRLYAARDYTGVKPFYYASRARRLCFASDIRRVLGQFDTQPRPNEGMIAEYLTGAFKNRDETLYEDVWRLPPGHQLTAENGAVSVSRFWDFNPAATIRYRRDEEYLEHFSEIFRTAVTACLRSVGTLGSTLSGGLDSSSVVGVAAAALQEDVSGRSLNTYSMVFPGQCNDESPYIDAVVAKWGLRSHRYPWVGFPDDPDWLRLAQEAQDIPDYPTLVMARPLFEDAVAHGVRVILTGEGGDTWFPGTRYPYRGLLSLGKFRRALGELTSESAASGYRYALSSLLRSLLWSAAPTRLRASIERARRPVGGEGFLSQQILMRTRFAERLHYGDCSERFADLAQWSLYRMATSGQVAHYAEIVDRIDAGLGIERWHPLLDRRIAEFIMAVPDYIHRSGKFGKQLLRGATPGVLPPLVAGRLDRGEFSVAFARALGSLQVSASLESPRAAVRNWLAPDALAACIQSAGLARTRDPRADDPMLFRCWMVFAMEAWWQGAYPG